jgi:hypothetical protein
MSPHVPEVLVEASEVSTSSQEVVDEQSGIAVLATKDENESGDYKLDSDPDVVLVTGADAALHLLPLRDDFDKALTFRSIILASGLACFQAVMTQIYSAFCSIPLKLSFYFETSLTINASVQTHPGFHPGNFSRTHFLLYRQCLGYAPSAR